MLVSKKSNEINSSEKKTLHQNVFSVFIFSSCISAGWPPKKTFCFSFSSFPLRASQRASPGVDIFLGKKNREKVSFSSFPVLYLDLDLDPERKKEKKTSSWFQRTVKMSVLVTIPISSARLLTTGILCTLCLSINPAASATLAEARAAIGGELIASATVAPDARSLPTTSLRLRMPTRVLEPLEATTGTPVT